MIVEVARELVAGYTGGLVAEVTGDLVAEVTGDLVAQGTLDLRIGVAFGCGGGGGVMHLQPLPEAVEGIIDFDLAGVLLASVVEIPKFFKVSW